ncbi:serine protease [Reyranella sp. CPCC 100927]|uniref:trypsin-like serine peptidase n=1 Tax=Reyranella sp. CPCC 100927 TaxID=2599616 RepID=UPI0011B40196|nr:trypsin-like peptidase domain-containing protein [Reyranella sp. CPCC 100927]TWS96316.1 hypothetical protein FQU96_39210 [Reyranella sp. CPCC 100927]
MRRRAILVVIAAAVLAVMAPGPGWAQALARYDVILKGGTITPSSGPARVLLAPQDVPGYQRFELVGLTDPQGDWRIEITTPSGQQYAIDAASVGQYLAYGNVIEIPVRQAGTVEIVGNAAAPRIRYLAMLRQRPTGANLFPFGEVNLDPVSSWSADLRTRFAPALAFIETTSPVDRIACSASQISPGVYLTALHCLGPQVGATCAPHPSTTIRVHFGAAILDGNGRPTAAARAGSQIAMPVFCGTGTAAMAHPWPLDYAVVMTPSAFPGSAPVRVSRDFGGGNANLVVGAYLPLWGSGMQGGVNRDFAPGLYLSRDQECRAYAAQNAYCPAGHVAHHCDTEPSMSGSPVLRRDTLQLVGVHYFGSARPNCAVPWPLVIEHMEKTASTKVQKQIVDALKQ